MANFNLENELSKALSLDVPLSKGPIPRWQRKAMEKSPDLSMSSCGNNSTLMNLSVNKSVSKPNASPKKDDWVKRLTPGRNNSTSKSPLHPQGDRFIPNRSAMQFELGHYMLSKNGGEGEENLSPKSSHYKKTMSENLNGDISNFRILAYQNKAPQAPTGHANGLKVLYSSSKNPGSTKKATRHIPQTPDRILDAPEILDDYYLNLIDWSSLNILAVALCGTVFLWNASSGEIQQLLDMPSQDEYVSSVSWLPEGNILAIGTSSAEVQLWDVSAEKKIRTMKSHTSRVPSLSWNTYILSSGSRIGTIHHHDVRVAEHHVGTLENHSQEVCGLRWSLDGRYLASGGNDNLVNVWQSEIGLGQTEAAPLHTFNEHQAAVKALAWCPWQPNILASGGGTADRHIRFWNCNLGSCLNSIDAKSQVCSILWSKEYKEIISGHGFANNELIIWKYPSMTKVCELIGHKSRVLNLAMSPDGATVVSAGADETLRLWNCFAYDPKKKKVSSEITSHRSDIMRSRIR
ncbi:cell division cycle protein 20 homolog [Uloborus diversus]|uniref:cell division cycle protein 20 homolog n=1 Tax=Uloborus diversus TaxID=327109 RepID=UPI00240951A5|nr:cell division cycle protein 20 homolog [Uloborus diversus]XP_054707823.1 cell division cycle protein 20 homolog [Uloborus diversus]